MGAKKLKSQAGHLLEPGDLVDGRYRIERLLSEGGVGIVFLAYHIELGYPVAIKVVRPELAESDEIIERTLCEAKTATRLGGEHVIQILDVGRFADGTPFIVMEYLVGEDLSQLLRRSGALEVPDAVGLLLQACEALARAHEAGIVHRDLKPENLFATVSPEGQVVLKILDFGIAKDPVVRRPERGRALTNPGFAMGSPEYMAPEQLLARPDVDYRADIWSLGAVAYELFTGLPPFVGDSLPEICSQVLAATPVLPRQHRADLPEALEGAVLRCLQKEPEQRFGDIQELARALSAFGTEQIPASGLVPRTASGLQLRTPTPSRHFSIVPSVQSDWQLDARPSVRASLARLPLTHSSAAPVSELGPRPMGAWIRRVTIALVGGLALVGVFVMSRDGPWWERLRELSSPTRATEPANVKVAPPVASVEDGLLVEGRIEPGNGGLRIAPAPGVDLDDPVREGEKARQSGAQSSAARQAPPRSRPRTRQQSHGIRSNGLGGPGSMESGITENHEGGGVAAAPVPLLTREIPGMPDPKRISKPETAFTRGSSSSHANQQISSDPERPAAEPPGVDERAPSGPGTPALKKPRAINPFDRSQYGGRR